MDAGEKLWSNVNLQHFAQMFIETTTAALVITDTNGIILWCNDRLTDIYEEPKNGIISSHLGDRIIYPKGVTVGERIKQAIELGYTELLKTKWVTKTGIEKFMHQRVYRLDDRVGNHIGFWGIGYELSSENQVITDTKNAVRVLADLQKEEIQEKQVDVIEMIKMQSEALCPNKNLRGGYCPAILAVEKALVEDQISLKMLLTNTEHKVAAYTKRRMAIKAISKEMDISERTVKNHRHSIRKKLNISNTNISLTKYLQSHPM
jgi:DNA-binding CsgD family transcriptional regulator